MDEATLERFPRFTWTDIKNHLSQKKPFEAISPMGTALIRFKSHKPLFGLAVHAGHRVREELLSKMAIEEEDRKYEEDQYIEEFISEMPLQMIALDSRFEYDLNLPRNQAVYLKPFQSWGKKVWFNPPTKDELEISDQKYDEFHELMNFFLEELQKQHKKVVVFDVHAYNFNRPNQAQRNSFPLFDLGTSSLDQKKYRKHIDFVLSELGKITLPGVDTLVKENELFKGDGAIATSIMSNHPDAFVVSLITKKIFMDEKTGKGNPNLIKGLASHIHEVAAQTMKQFAGR